MNRILRNNLSNEERLDFLKQNIIAHRGMHNINIGVPENSILAFEKAIKNNYIIELDLHILEDGNIVVFHDDNLERMTGINKKIKDTTYDEIKSLKLQDTNMNIPLFRDVLELINGKVPLIIELKYDVKTGILERETINLLKDYKGKYAIKSFNPNSIIWLKKNAPKIIRGQLSSNFRYDKINFIKKMFLKSMIFNKISKPDFISYDIRALPNNKINKLRKNKLILGWTIHNKEDMKKAKLYCDNYICENIEEIR